MELAKVTAKGQITIPLVIRNMLGLKTVKCSNVHVGGSKKSRFPNGR